MTRITDMLTGDWAGLALLFITYLSIFICKDTRDSKTLFAAFFLILTLHHIVAIFNAYVGATIGAGTDSKTFYKTAVSMTHDLKNWHFAVGAPFYRFFLACFYKLLGASVFLGEELSILAFLLSCFVFIKICKLLNYSKHLPLLLIIFGSLPSMILIGSVILRESWEILFFMLAVYFCLNNLNNENLVSWAGCIISTCIMALFHEGLIIFIFLLLGLMICWRLCNPFFWKNLVTSKKSLYTLLFTILATIAIFMILNFTMSQAPELEAFHAIVNGNPLSFITYFRNMGLQVDARTSYGMVINTSTSGNFILTFIPTYLYYMFSPFLWQIHNGLDLYAALESALRFILIISAIIALVQTHGEQRKSIFFLFAVFFLMSSLWSLGTLNYGTSIRHHLLSYWILVLLLGINIQSLSWRKIK